MKIFVSHSLVDKELLESIQKTLSASGMQLLIAEHILELNVTISEKIKRMINLCDVGLVLLTRNGINSHFISEEIGYLEAKSKLIIRVIEKGYTSQYSGFKYGMDFIELDTLDPNKAINLITDILIKHKNQLMITNRNAVLFALAVVFLLSNSSPEN